MMKKLLSIIVLSLLLNGNAFATTVEDFKCTPKKLSQKHSDKAKNDYNFMLVSTNSETQKYVTYNIEDNVAMAWVYTEKFLVEKMGVTGYKSYTEWTTIEYNFWDYFPEEYTVTNYMLTNRKKDGRLVLAATILGTNELIANSNEREHNDFLKLEKLRNEHTDNKEKYFAMFKKDTKKLYSHFGTNWNIEAKRIGKSNSKAALIGWNCKKT